MRVQSAVSLLLLIAALALSACGGASAGTGTGGGLPYGEYPPPDGPRDVPPGSPPDEGSGEAPFPDLYGGVLATIDSSGERWRWWVTEPYTAQALYEVWTGARTLLSLAGALRAGPGLDDHNAPWSWHVDPQQSRINVNGLLAPEMARSPSDCESRLSYWLSTGAPFAPVDATIVGFLDRRMHSEPPVPR